MPGHAPAAMPSAEPPPPSSSTAAPGADAAGAPPPESLDAAQSHFLAHMSHELRTPLAGLLGLVDLARRVAADPAQRRYLEVAMQSGRALQRTIEHVLDIARLRDGRVTLADEPFDLAESVAEVLRGAMPLVRAKGLSMRYDWEGEPTWVRGDELRVRQLVGNLVDNAARFTEHGHVALRARLDEHPQRPGWRLFGLEVEDTGPGMAPDGVARMFGDFVQGDASLMRNHGGAGLGLPIAQEIARRLGGRIEVASTPGAGCVFSVTLPLAGAPDPDPLPDPVPGHAWLLYHQRDIGEWLQRRLRRIGWSAELVAGCDAAAAQARHAAPGSLPALVVVAEHVLAPETDLDALRAALPAADIRLLIRPDWDQPALERRALALGMRLDVMPLSPRDLRLMTSRHAAPAAAPAPMHPARAGAHVLVVEDNATNRMIFEAFLEALGLPWRSVGDGAQAIDDCARTPPRLVLMDLQMPVLDGLEATRELRARQARGELPDFPIIALTAHAMASDAEACRAAGMVGYLTKPLLLDALKLELARWIPDL
jgi:CheY-like chemotaxis protein